MRVNTSSMLQKGLVRQLAYREGGDEIRPNKVRMNWTIKNEIRNISAMVSDKLE